MKLKNWPCIVLLMLSVVSCKKDTTGETNIEASVKTDVAYGTDPKQQMDIYLPKGRSVTKTKVMIMIHGGAWKEGDKADFNQYVDTLKKRFPDYALFNINYRLSTGIENSFPTQENDVKSATEFIYSKRSAYGISDQFVLLGASAGGHLALLQGYKYTSPVKVRAIINFFGPSDMVDVYNNPASSMVSSALIASVVGATPASNGNLYLQSSPITFITAQSTPTISFQGGLDPLVRPAQQVALHAKLSANAVVNEYVFYPNEYHGWVGASLSNSFDRIQAFLNVHVK